MKDKAPKNRDLPVISSNDVFVLLRGFLYGFTLGEEYLGDFQSAPDVISAATIAFVIKLISSAVIRGTHFIHFH